MIVKIAGADIDYQRNSLEIDDAIGERSTASFEVIDRNGSLSFAKGQQVEIRNDDNTIVFSGAIDNPVRKDLSLVGTGKIHSIRCVDNIFISDKKIIAKAYTDMLAGDIVRDILTTYLAAEGVTAGTIQDGDIITEAVFNYISVTRALERLAEVAGFEFNIDENKQLQFFHRATNYNDTVITETSDIKNLQVEAAAEDYRNKQYIKAGMDTTDPQTETKKGDGITKTFTVGYPIAKVPTITVNGTAQTVGIKGLDTGKKWYWNKGENVFSQDDSETALTTSQTLTIAYQGLFNIVVVSSDSEEIDRMKALDGTSGIYEQVTDDPYSTDRDAAFESAAAKLKRYAKVGKRIKFDTKITGMKPGQLIQVQLASYNIDDYFLIESSRAVELGTQDGRMVYSVSVVDGSATGGWANFFKQLANKGESFVLRENIQEDEVLTTLEQFTKTWVSTEQPNIFKDINPGPTVQPGSSTFPGFEKSDRVKYLVLFNNATEIFRKPITKLTESTGQLVSTTYIAPFEANHMSITDVGWIGGSFADNNSGTGIVIQKIAWAKSKTESEAVQIDKTELKGW